MPKKRTSGFVALIGRPNVGKSTLLNRLAGEKLAIVSPKPQTTRHRILGVVTRPQGQVAFLDTPGIHKAEGGLNRYMVDVALHAISEVDLILFLVDPPISRAGSKARVDPKPQIGEGSRFILEKLRAANKPVILGINKVDAVPKAALLPLIDLYRTELPFLEVIPISAKTGEGTDTLMDRLLAHLPVGDLLFPEDMLTDQAERVLVAEYVREAVMRHCRQEIPYSTAVDVEVFDESEREGNRPVAPGKLSGLVRIAASVFVERDSQKAIVVGKRGQMLKEIGTDARKSIERLLGTHVYLSLRVKVEERWSERPETLRRLGYQ